MFCELPEFGRCCFCMPLRKGVLVFGYLNILFSAFMVGVYSYSVHHNADVILVYHGVTSNIEDKFCLAIYCVDIMLNALMVCGAHRQIPSYIRVFYYYMMVTTGALVVLEIVSITTSGYFDIIELVGLFFTGLCLNLYLLFLVRSLLKKMENSGGACENQLQQFINGEVKVETNGIYPSIVIPIENS